MKQLTISLATFFALFTNIFSLEVGTLRSTMVEDATLLSSKMKDYESHQVTQVNINTDVIIPVVQLSDIVITIFGNVNFPFVVDMLPEPSCLVVKFKDLTYLDISSYVVSSIAIDVSGMNVNRSIKYSINSTKPVGSHLNRTFTLTAIINIGWCQERDSDEWIRKGDFLSAKRHHVMLKSNEKLYNRDIDVLCYSCEKKDYFPGDFHIPAIFEAKAPPPEVIPIAVMSDEVITVSGEIIFPMPVHTLPESSCVIVKLKDVSFTDFSSNVVASTVIHITGTNVKSIEYSLNSKKPVVHDLDRVSVITVVVNIGWCKDKQSNEWLRKGDYLSVKRYRAMLKDDTDSYRRDVDVVCYLCDEKIEFIPIDVDNTSIARDEKITPSTVTKTFSKSLRDKDGKDEINGAIELTNEVINIAGEIMFPSALKLQEPSCVIIKLKDVSLVNGPSYVLASNKIDVSSNNVNRGVGYSLTSKKPTEKYLNRFFAVSAVVNNGWCKDENANEWIRKGDYLSAKRHRLILRNHQYAYAKDIDVICYACNEQKGVSVQDSKKAKVKLNETDEIIVSPGPEEEKLPLIIPFDGSGPVVKLSKDDINIAGNIIFPFAIQMLPMPSCAIIKFQDVTFMDVPTNVIASTKIDVSERNINKTIAYSLSSKKPVELQLNRVFTITAVVNVGWCMKNTTEEWIRNGDFLSVSHHRIILKSNEDVYGKDINVICYFCGNMYDAAGIGKNLTTTISESEDKLEAPDGGIAVKTSDKYINIRGYIVFTNLLGVLPDGSTLTITLKDISYMDAFSNVLASVEIDMSRKKLTKSIGFFLKSKMPTAEYLNRVFALSAVLNVGWHKDINSNEWIRKGDYLSVKRYRIMLKENKYSYNSGNISAVCYGCDKQDVSNIGFKSAAIKAGTTDRDVVPKFLQRYRGPKGYKGEEGVKGNLGILGRTGLLGLPGPPGYQGSDGEFGYLGPTGIKGKRGVRGIDGLPGFRNGPKGTQGERGTAGGWGVQGIIGYKGYKGQLGEHGPPGAPGQMGNHGDRGSFGAPGERGVPGKKGAEGLLGTLGPKGKLGPNGPLGKKGNQGIQGDQGDNGISGIKGYMGAIGRMGFTGEDGNSGKIGQLGPNGPPGVQGDTGYAGVPGKFGNRGALGEGGTRGDIGVQGLKGDYGFDGMPGKFGKIGGQGLRGMRGRYGEQGLRGRRGPKGSKGTKGLIGHHGFKGIPGTAGLHGTPGIVGDKGEAGTPGEKGPRGPKGNRGSRGGSGPEGSIGPRGLTGPVGEDGNDGENGEKGTRGDHGDTGSMGEKGSRGPIGKTGVPGIKGRKGGRGVIGIRGDTGEKGEEGYPGHPGEPGDRGHYGEQGLKGPTGEDGIAGQTGFKGNKGEIGQPGKDGISGEKGEQGDEGEPGEEGLVGLKGDIGTKGLSGVEGPRGLAGLVGEPGLDGKSGLIGKTGIPGSIGPDGKPGPRGIIGKLGKLGPPGPTGERGVSGKRGRGGKNGIRGTPGKEGEEGNTGFPGQKGIAGDQGKRGFVGERGAPGRRGEHGITGPIGLPGTKGIKGRLGKKGYPGPGGDRGDPGIEGRNGNLGQDGLPGTPGPYGAAGTPGPPGLPGKSGMNGTNGLTGPRGETGLLGDQGNQGKRGKTGIIGLSGDMGVTGLPGELGRQGEVGKTGSGGGEGLQGGYGKTGDIGVSGIPGKRGLQGLLGLPGLNGNIGKTGNKGNSGKDGPNGEKGKVGSVGPNGIDGEIGKPGEDGAKGKEGRNGLRGKPGHGGREGDVGDVGEPGNIGLPGLKGRMGRSGFRGYHGKRGPQGDIGNPGREGGEPGPRGPEGIPGKRGTPGDNGRKGIMGSIGDQGKDGLKGFRGSPGTKGRFGVNSAIGKRGRPGEPGMKGKFGLRGGGGYPGHPGTLGPPGNEGDKGPKGQRGNEGPVGLKGPPGAPPIESLIPNARWRDYYQKNPTQFYQAVAGEYLTYISNEVDDLKYPRGTKSNPALNCKEMYDNGKYTSNGLYWIDPTRGCAWDAFQVLCNFTAGGESCLAMNTTHFNIKRMQRDENNEIVISKYRAASFSVSKPQLNFIRILSNEAWQVITLFCTSPIIHKDNIELMGWNKKIFNVADKNRVKILSDSCHKPSISKPGKIVLRIFTDVDLSDLPIMDMAIKHENVDSIHFGNICFL